jgi:DNA-binding XRE family transcriptional regulator
MKKKEFAEIRRHLGKTQNQIAQVLGVSIKAVQSFEQGWREIPVHIERQILLILALKNHDSEKDTACWLMRDCPVEKRQECPAWQFNAGNLCWFINGTICEGSPQGTWQKKMKICRECEVYRSILPTLGRTGTSLEKTAVHSPTSRRQRRRGVVREP